MKVRIIVPRRADNGERDKLWAYCKAYWTEQRPGWEIVEGDHTEGPFNRSAAINLAAKGEWDIAVILDGDTIIDADQVEAGIARASETGWLTLPFKVRCLLGRDGTRRILDGYRGSWDRFVTARQAPSDAYEYISGCQIVPRKLWDKVGGFDERFEGWGGEDDAFHAACMALSGRDPRKDRLDGNVWHLWHRPSPDADHRTATWKQAKALSDRYIAAAEDEGAIRRLLAESRAPDQVVVVTLTNGRRDTLDPALTSVEEMLGGPIGRKIICNDSGQPIERDGWDTVPIGSSSGYTRAVTAAIGEALGSGQPWIFWLEDDFTLTEPIDLRAMQQVMDANPGLAQLSLKRQAWYPHEVEAGGITEAKPEAFEQRDGFVAHRDYWTMNPMLCRRSFLAEHPWPRKRDSERWFGHTLFRNRPDLSAGILGRLDDPPRCEHIGKVRAGVGY